MKDRLDQLLEWYDTEGVCDGDGKLIIEKARSLALESSQAEKDKGEDIEDYDAGLLNDYGGGNVGWWQDYIRNVLAACNEHWRNAVSINTPQEEKPAVERHKCPTCSGQGWYSIDDGHGGAMQEQCGACYGNGYIDDVTNPPANADMVGELEDVIRAYTFRNNDDDFNSGCNRVCERISEIITKYRPVKAHADEGLWQEFNERTKICKEGLCPGSIIAEDILKRHKASDKGVE